MLEESVISNKTDMRAVESPIEKLILGFDRYLYLQRTYGVGVEGEDTVVWRQKKGACAERIIIATGPMSLDLTSLPDPANSSTGNCAKKTNREIAESRIAQIERKTTGRTYTCCQFKICDFR